VIGRLITPALYRCATTLAGPAIHLLLARRRRRDKEDGARIAERWGFASKARPAGPLVWLHAASVGESLAVLPLIDALRRERPALGVLVTSGTVTSAQLLAERLPRDALHQYVPVDRLSAVRRFLARWQPTLALWVESELWPNLVLETAARNVPMVMLNARLSARSASRWQSMPRLIGPMLASFRAILAQSEDDAARFRTLGAGQARHVGNLKYDAPVLRHDERALADLRATIGERPLWLAASTHNGEEEAALRAHRHALQRWPTALLIIVPRHPKRADTIAALADGAGLPLARRSKGETIEANTRVYLADTLGELGLFYALAPIVFVGGSLTPVGGHNLIEPARLDCALITGPDVTNSFDAAAALTRGSALITVRDGDELAHVVEGFVADPARRHYAAESARAIAATLGGALDETLKTLEPYLPSRETAHSSHARA